MTREEQIQAAIESFFANREHTEREKAMVTEFIMGSDVLTLNLDNPKFEGKKIIVMGNFRAAGLTQSLLSAVGVPQKFAQVDANYPNSLKEEERENPPKTELTVFPPLIQQTPIFDTSSTKKRYNRRSKNNKFF